VKLLATSSVPLQASRLTEECFRYLELCCIDCVLIAPLIRLITLATLRFGVHPPACASWRGGVYSGCRGAVVQCLEALAESASGVSMGTSAGNQA
jgi:hypothetical protein